MAAFEESGSEGEFDESEGYCDSDFEGEYELGSEGECWYTPLENAAGKGDEREVAHLLAAGAAVSSNVLKPAAYAACQRAHVGVLRLLLGAGLDAAADFGDGSTLLHFAAGRNGSPDAQFVKLVLEAAPAAAAAADSNGLTPLHTAALFAKPAAVRLLLEAAPSTASLLDGDGLLPLYYALVALVMPGKRATAEECARLLTEAAPAAQPTLSTLIDLPTRRLARTLLPDLVARLPLTEADWRSIPAPWPQLAAALPAVLRRSTAEAGWLVALLTPKQRQRLRTAALCLARAALPGEVSCGILLECLAGG